MIKSSYKIIIAMIILTTGALSACTAPADQETAEVRAVLDQVFDAMRAGDDESLKTLILEDTSLDRITPGAPVERANSSGWINWVSTLEPGQADEQIFDVEIHVEGPLAVAWAPFTIAIDGELKSCGVNQFTQVFDP